MHTFSQEALSCTKTEGGIRYSKWELSMRKRKKKSMGKRQKESLGLLLQGKQKEQTVQNELVIRLREKRL